MSIRGYPDYKGSNLPYIDSVPSHWTLKKIAWDIPYSVGWTPPSGNEDYYDGDIPWVTISDLEKQSVNATKSTITELAVDVRKAKPVPPGSLLFSFKLSVGKVTFTEIECFTNEAIAAFEPNKTITLSYWYYASPLIIPHYGRDNIYGAKLLNQDLIGSVKFYCPSKTEQKKIAQFLDYETAKIDALIDEQKRLIELLKEKRQAVISHAVTKGLNPDAPMKESGVEWLGAVPEHWSVVKLGYISNVVRGGSPRPAGDPTLFNGDFSPWVTVREITKNEELYITETETSLTKKGSDQCRVFKSGTLLLSNSGATLGVPKILKIDANANDGVVGFESLQLDNRYVYFFLSLMTKNIRDEIRQGSGQPNLNTDIIKDFLITMPPNPEINQIVAKCIEINDGYQKLTRESFKTIELLKERRSALISAAVTGKIDVRDWQPPAGSDTVDSNASVQTERHYG